MQSKAKQNEEIACHIVYTVHTAVHKVKEEVCLGSTVGSEKVYYFSYYCIFKAIGVFNFK